MNLLRLLTLAAAGCLADDDWHVREAGSVILAAVAPDWQLTAMAGHHDAEVARRSQAILDARRNAWLAEGLAAIQKAVADEGLPVWPWIDSLPADTVERFSVISPYLERAKDCGFVSNGPDFAAYCEASRMWFTDQLWYAREHGGQDVLPGLMELARRMVKGDREQCRRAGYRWVGR